LRPRHEPKAGCLRRERRLPLGNRHPFLQEGNKVKALRFAFQAAVGSILLICSAKVM